MQIRFPMSTSISFAAGSIRVLWMTTGETGEVQIWNVETGELQLSKIVSYDTVYGVSWSPDGSLVAFGCTGTNLRAVDSAMYAIAFNPSGTHVTVAGADGMLRTFETETASPVSSVRPVEVSESATNLSTVADWHYESDRISQAGNEDTPRDSINGLIVFPTEINLASPLDYASIVVQAKTDSGSTFPTWHSRPISLAT